MLMVLKFLLPNLDVSAETPSVALQVAEICLAGSSHQVVQWIPIYLLPTCPTEASPISENKAPSLFGPGPKSWSPCLLLFFDPCPTNQQVLSALLSKPSCSTWLPATYGTDAWAQGTLIPCPDSCNSFITSSLSLPLPP